MDFAPFDRRHYPIVAVRDGYREWVPTYEATVEKRMDLGLLESLDSVPWSTIDRAADLGCGTGRTGAWLRARGVSQIDGIDLTPEMLAVARERKIYASLREADVTATGLDGGAYALVTTCLVDEHLRDVRPFYREVSRLLRPSGFHVLVGYHPHFMTTAGVPTHFDRASGEPVAIETFVHLFSDHVLSAREGGLRLLEMREEVIDQGWLALKPRWQPYVGLPLSFAFVWQKASAG